MQPRRHNWPIAACHTRSELKGSRQKPRLEWGFLLPFIRCTSWWYRHHQPPSSGLVLRLKVVESLNNWMDRTRNRPNKHSHLNWLKSQGPWILSLSSSSESCQAKGHTPWCYWPKRLFGSIRSRTAKSGAAMAFQKRVLHWAAWICSSPAKALVDGL